MNTARMLVIAALGLAACADDGAASHDGALDAATAPTLHLNELQLLATHNSYHTAPTGSAVVADWLYSHAPLDEQLSKLGVRGFELDTHFDDGALNVHHIPGLDDGTTCSSLQACLQVMKRWSDAHPDHHALFLQIEPKDEDVGETPDYTAYADALDEVVLSVWPRERIVAPADVQGDAATLRDAVRHAGWPSVDATRGKLLVYLDDRTLFHQAYTRGGSDIHDRLAFPSSEPDEPIAAVMVLNDPTAAATRSAVEQGFIVRTRADGVPVPSDIAAQRDAALDSGAQILTTDFPAAVADQAEAFTLPGGRPSRCNPVTAPKGCQAQDIE